MHINKNKIKNCRRHLIEIKEIITKTTNKSGIETFFTGICFWRILILCLRLFGWNQRWQKVAFFSYIDFMHGSFYCVVLHFANSSAIGQFYTLNSIPATDNHCYFLYCYSSRVQRYTKKSFLRQFFPCIEGGGASDGASSAICLPLKRWLLLLGFSRAMWLLDALPDKYQ